MPTVSFFYGIAVRMYLRDHPPPHFHAVYQQFEANVSIETGEIIEGRLPVAARRMVKDWALLRRDALLQNWQNARQGLPMRKIAGLDDD